MREEHMLVNLITQKNQKFKITQSTLVIGRDESCDLHTNSRSISRKHCAVIKKKGRVYIKDLGSSNGTFVNGERLKSGGHVEVFDYDTVRLGKLEFRLSILDEITELPHMRSFKPDTPPDDTNQSTGGTVFETAEAIAADRAAIKEKEADEQNDQSVTSDLENVDTGTEPGQDDFGSDELKTAFGTPSDSSAESEGEDSDEEAEAEKAPGKLPEHLRRKAITSRDAARDALSRHFRR